MAKNKTLLIVAGLGIAGFGLYEYMKKRNSTIVVDDSGQPVTTPYSNLLPGSGSTVTTTVTTPSTTTQTSTPGRPFSPSANTSAGADVGTDNSAITSVVSSSVMNWINADGRPPVIAMGQARIPSEFNGMYAIIQGGWTPTAAQTQFWNQLRNKYDPTHKYW